MQYAIGHARGIERVLVFEFTNYSGVRYLIGSSAHWELIRTAFCTLKIGKSNRDLHLVSKTLGYDEQNLAGFDRMSGHAKLKKQITSLWFTSQARRRSAAYVFGARHVVSLCSILHCFGQICRYRARENHAK